MGHPKIAVTSRHSRWSSTPAKDAHNLFLVAKGTKMIRNRIGIGFGSEIRTRYESIELERSLVLTPETSANVLWGEIKRLVGSVKALEKEQTPDSVPYSYDIYVYSHQPVFFTNPKGEPTQDCFLINQKFFPLPLQVGAYPDRLNPDVLFQSLSELYPWLRNLPEEGVEDAAGEAEVSKCQRYFLTEEQKGDPEVMRAKLPRFQ